MPTTRQVVTSVLVGIGVVTLLRKLVAGNTPRPRRPNRLFLYRFESRPIRAGESNPVGVGAVATIDPYSFEIKRQFLLSPWDFVASAATGNKMWLLLNDGNTSTTAVGRIGKNFNLEIVHTFPRYTFNFPFRFVVVNGLGYLLMVGSDLHGILFAFGQVLDDGTFVEWWRIPMPDYQAFPRGVVGLLNTHLVYFNDPVPGPGSTVQIFDVKHARMLSSRRYEDPIKWVIADGELIYICFEDPLRTTEMCVLNASQELMTVKRTQFDTDLMFTEPFEDVVSTPGAHLCFDYQTLKGFGTIRVLSRDGFKVTGNVRDQDWPWYYYTPC